LTRFRSAKAPEAEKSNTQCYTSSVSPAPPSTLSILKGKAFVRFAKRARISDSDLWQAAQRANDGLVDADLGGGVIKQRIARAGEGRSGGSRSIVLFKKNNRAVFVYGFEKKDVANIGRREVEAFRELAAVILGYTDADIVRLVGEGALIRVEGEVDGNG